jgi:hypothetical protein
MENQRIMRWFQESLKKDSVDLEIEKSKVINSIKGLKKTDLFEKQKKLTLWQKIKRILNF